MTKFRVIFQVTLAELLLSLAGEPLALAQFVKDPPWNSEHIDSLPKEVRSAVLAMCPSRPDAAHYFATYSNKSQQINLHFEKFHCGQRADAACANTAGAKAITVAVESAIIASFIYSSFGISPARQVRTGSTAPPSRPGGPRITNPHHVELRANGDRAGGLDRRTAGPRHT